MELRFGISHFGKAALWAVIEIYALFSLTDLLRLPAELAGLIFFVLLLWSAASDMIVGVLIDRWLSPKAVTRVLRLCVLPMSLAFVAGLVPVAGTGGAAALGAAFLFRPLYSMIDVPHNGLLRELGRDPVRRRRLSTIRLLCGAAASFGVAYLATVMLRTSAHATDAVQAYRRFVVVVAGISGVLLLATPPLRGAGAPEALDAPRATTAILRDPLVLLVFGATMLGIVGASLFQKTLPYIARYQFDDPRWTGRAMLVLAAGKLLAAPLWTYLAARCGARAGSVAAYAFGAIGAVLFAIALTRLLPFELALLLLGAGIGGASLLSWILVAELVERLEFAHARRLQGSLFGLFTCLSKVALGLGGTLLGMILAADGGLSGTALATICTLVFVSATAAIVSLRVARRYGDTARDGRSSKKVANMQIDAAPITPA
ncbi:MFS transporter [Sphingomonas sp. PL20]|uniref:MFS transporter n=1 Tax=Sphingomonas sp. PL20 TaxID=2760712 RepID=UPI001AE4C853